MPVTRSPYSPNTPQSYNAHNTAVNSVIDGVNGHSHDPNASTGPSSAGSYIPQFGSADSRYATVGPGSAGWSSLNTQTNKAAIPADPNESVLDPTGAITYGHGIGAEIARIRGQLAKLTSGSLTGAWNANTGQAIQFSAGGSGRDLSMGALTATSVALPVTDSVAPFALTYTGTVKPALISNLNADYLRGVTISNTAGTPSTLIPTNAQGLYSQSFVAADVSEGAVYNGTLTTTNTIQDNLNNLRFVLQQWGKAAFGTTGHWNTAATTTIPLVTGLGTQGSTITGSIQFVSGIGIQVSQTGTNTIQFDSTGAAPFTDAPVLNYPDMLKDTAISGSIAPSTTALTITINSGLIGYVNGTRIQNPYSVGPLTVVTNSTNWVFWNGGNQVSSFNVRQTSTSPGAGWVLIGTGTLTATATNANQTTAGGAWTIVTNNPTLNTKPIITGSRSSGAALVSLLSQLSTMGFIIDNTVA